VKNFSFLLNARNEWTFAPAYDLVFSYGPGGEQSMLVMGEGRNPGTAQLQALGKLHGIKYAPEILAKVKRAVANWPRYAEQADVSRKSTKEIVGKIKLQ
jgi:serine/threonine-protein kinase HipA